jgi:hypothetical protein
MAEHISGRANNYDKLDVIEEHLHGTGRVYPNLAGTVTLTCGTAAAWDLGTIVEIIPTGTIGSDFDIHWVSITGISANDEYQLCLYVGAAASEVLISEVDFVRNSVQSQEGSHPIITPVISVRSNNRISAAIACAGGTAKTANVKVRYHIY